MHVGSSFTISLIASGSYDPIFHMLQAGTLINHSMTAFTNSAFERHHCSVSGDVQKNLVEYVITWLTSEID